MKIRLRHQILSFAAIRMVFNTMHRMVYPFLPVFARGLGVELGTLSLAITARSVLGTFGPFLAVISDRRGRKLGMLFGLVLFVAGTALVVFWPGLPTFIAALLLTTLGKYIFDPPMQAYLGDRIPYHRRGLALAATELGWS
ncbi:MAG: MFS transporter, partial [Anaerolineales bacterium]|nr:MFS transporter [Anaerolineales bacterium]